MLVRTDKDEEQKVKLSAKNLYKKLFDNRNKLLVVDWYKDEQPIAKLKHEVELSLMMICLRVMIKYLLILRCLYL